MCQLLCALPLAEEFVSAPNLTGFDPLALAIKAAVHETAAHDDAAPLQVVVALVAAGADLNARSKSGSCVIGKCLELPNGGERAVGPPLSVRCAERILRHLLVESDRRGEVDMSRCLQLDRPVGDPYKEVCPGQAEEASWRQRAGRPSVNASATRTLPLLGVAQHPRANRVRRHR